MLDYTPSEWETFTTVEKRIILLVRRDGIEDKKKIMGILTYPLPHMKEITFRGHWARIQRKMKDIRDKRIDGV
jgi:ABC-type antimicrobial peptide transport system ATPase subunit